jgi:adenylate cyclase
VNWRASRNVPLVTAVGATLVAVALVAVDAWVTVPGLADLEGFTVDARFRARGPREPATDRIVIVGLDDKTRDEASDVFQTRRGWARLIDALAGYDPKLVALDLFFSTPEVILPDALASRVDELDRRLPPGVDGDYAAAREAIAQVADELRGDAKLAAAVARAKRVYLGANFLLGNGVASAPEPVGLEPARHGEVADAGGGGQRRPASADRVVFTLPAIAKGAVGAGAVNAYRDADGVVRRLPLVIEYAGRHYMSLGLAVALAELGKPNDTSYIVGAPTLAAAGHALPVTVAGSAQLDMLGKGRFAMVSAADVLAHRAPREALAGKLVFVGYTFATYDKVATPLDATADGIELHATLAENVLADRLLVRTGPIASIVATLLLCAIVVAAQLRRVRRRAWVPPVLALAAILAYLAIAYLMFLRGTVVAIAAPVLATGVVVIAATIGGLATEGREKAHLRAVFSQYVSRSVVDRILADPAKARLGGERKELTVLFSDIRGFSQLAEGLRPEVLASFLQEYLTPMTELVLESGGTLDKYIGDAVMAIWSAPIDFPDHAARACDVALAMQAALVTLNQKWVVEGRPEIAIGIGVNTGQMAVGNMGSAARFDYTVLGDQVNLASRLEGLTKEYGVGILVGEATMRAAGDRFVFREIDLVRVKGRAGAAPVYELCGRHGESTASLTGFADALAAYRRREFEAARSAFAAIDRDPAAAAMATRCSVLSGSPPPADWDGVYEQRSK